MRIQRTKNASRNIFYGIILRLYQVIGPFVIRTAMIYILGMEYVGLNSLFTSILQVLNMTELGVGTAMVFSMYKPIAEDDTEKICALMRLYKLYYRTIGVIIAVIGLTITPFVPKLINNNNSIPLNITYLYWLNLGYTVLSYWLFAYKNSILLAHQRTDVISKVTIGTNTCMYLVQLVFLIITKNYYFYLIGMLFGQALTNIVTAYYANKLYPQYKAKGNLSKEEIKSINQRVKDLFTAKVGGVVQNSADSIVISIFLGLTILGRYNNYYYILNAVFGFIIILLNACLAGVGNSIVLDSKEKNYSDLNKIALLIEWIAGFSACCLLCLYQPFVSLWTGKDNVLSFGIVICLSLYLYIIITNQMLCLYKDASGIWHSDRFRPLITALINLVLNIITVQIWGLYGVVLSTVVSMLFVGIPWLIHNLFTSVFKMSSYDFLKKLIMYFALTILACILTYFLCSFFSEPRIIDLIVRFVICLIVPNTIYYFTLSRTRVFSDSIRLINHAFGGRLKKIPFLKKYV